MASKVPGLNKKSKGGEFKEGPGAYECSSCGDKRNKIYPLGAKQYCTKCFKKGDFK